MNAAIPINTFSHELAPLARSGVRRARLTQDFSYRSPTLGLIVVFQDFETDYASTPRPIWGLYPPDGKYTEAAVIHDWLYRHLAIRPTGPRLKRRQADWVILEAMAASQVPFHRRWIIYLAVRCGGWVTWRKRLRKLQTAQPSD